MSDYDEIRRIVPAGTDAGDSARDAAASFKCASAAARIGNETACVRHLVSALTSVGAAITEMLSAGEPPEQRIALYEVAERYAVDIVAMLTDDCAAGI